MRKGVPMKQTLGNKKVICLFVLPALTLFLLIVLFPIIMSAYYSLLDWDGIGEKVWIGIENYKTMFVENTDGFFQAIGNSILLVALSVFVQLPISLLLALVLANGVPGENFYRTVYFVPVILSTVVIGQLWTKIYQPEYGLLNTLLNGIGLDSLAHQWLADPKTALLSAFVPTVWQYIGYQMLIMYAGIKAIPTEIFESARIDGASGPRIAAKITIPLIKSTLTTCVIFAVIGSLKVFDIVYIMTKGGPMHASEVPSTVMYSAIFQRNQYGYGSAIAIFIVIECLIFTLIIQKAVQKENN